MDTLKSPGTIILSSVTLAALVAGLFVTLVMVWGFAYGGFESTRFNIAESLNALSALALFIGLIGASSRHPGFAMTSLLGSAWLVFEVGRYTAFVLLHSAGTPPNAIACLLLIVGVESAAVMLSSLKLKQLCTSR